jgi:hypothetical protein
VGAALLAGLILCACAVPAGARQGVSEPEGERVAPPPAVTLAILPSGTEPEDLGEIEGISPGVLSAGLAEVTEVQTFLDISAGNRVFTSLYDRQPPVITAFGRQVPDWGEIVERADSPPAEIVPGLLGSTLRDAGIPARADRLLVAPALAAADRQGRVERNRPFACLDRRCPGFNVVPATLGRLPVLIARLGEEDLLIAIERPPPAKRDTLAIGVAGEGFDGNLTSDTTRTSGFVLATDVAPTVLERYGIEPPGEISGEPIRAEGEVDAAAVADRAARMRVVAKRRAPVVLYNVLIWLAVALAVAGLSRWRWAPRCFAVFGLSVVYLPLLLLVAAALDPSRLAERVLVGLGAPLIAASTLLMRGRSDDARARDSATREMSEERPVSFGWPALAIACGLTTGAYAIDIVAGSPLTARSLLGPNPGLGVRFFGIGNELEAALAVIIPVGIGAVLTGSSIRGRPPDARLAVGAFLVAGAVGALLFAAGRFGADVGAAIVLPAGAAVAAISVPGMARRRTVFLVIAAPLLGLAGLALLDLALGGDAHLSRSVLEAGGADDLAEVIERRLRLSASSFNRGLEQPLFWAAVALILAAIALRARIAAWLEAVPLARAGFIGAAVAVALGVVANDSGAIFLIIGSIGLAACLGFAWAAEQNHAD